MVDQASLYKIDSADVLSTVSKKYLTVRSTLVSYASCLRSNHNLAMREQGEKRSTTKYYTKKQYR
jgi:hypothetical protein